MELRISGKNTEVLPAARDYIERKLGKLARHLPQIMESKVEITEEKTRSPKQHFVVQITVNSKGTLLRAEHRAEDLFQAVDKTVATMQRQITHYKGKHYDKGRGNSLAKGGLSAEVLESQPRLTKNKRFIVKPMPPDEAIDQMELLGHDFFLFYNIDSDGINLVYRRRDGNYGLIEPELK